MRNQAKTLDHTNGYHVGFYEGLEFAMKTPEMFMGRLREEIIREEGERG